MATWKANDLMSRSRHMSAYGDIIAIPCKVDVPNTLANGDVIRAGIIQAGIEVFGILYGNAALCASGGNAKFGFVPVDGSNPGPDDDYFSGQASLTAPFAAVNNGAWLARFDRLKLEYDVFLDITMTSTVTTPAAGAFYATVFGRAVGVK